jgi:hypothetical protein
MHVKMDKQKVMLNSIRSVVSVLPAKNIRKREITISEIYFIEKILQQFLIIDSYRLEMKHIYKILID